jgi:hypothetical protein
MSASDGPNPAAADAAWWKRQRDREAVAEAAARAAAADAARARWERQLQRDRAAQDALTRSEFVATATGAQS